MNIVEVIFYIILICIPLIGFRKGFVKTVTPIISGLLSFAIMYILKDWGFAFLFQWVIFGANAILARTVVVLLVFALGSFLFKVLIQLLNIFTKLPIIKGMNRILGLLFGAVEGFIIVWFFMYFISLFLSQNWGVWFYDGIEKNEFLLYLYNHNIIAEMMSIFTSI